ncbi:diguanylate cyclase [Clostridium sp. MCC353]|uniref:GGDEF domain-containing protein n=1 Tax=Clostridium sp. MCC353 TaxID=2592646 RepID=UPI001C01BFBE|nr:GGDEF domain-containing protein [Clostridium sp. MCC353]MBT9776949.1 diguanylate cyclase [Clostridium sp. MCC353]
MFIILLVGAVYFYFNWQYFHLASQLMESIKPRLGLVITSFGVNYIFFFICSILEFPLILNWILFAFLLLFETLLYDHRDFRTALFCTLMSIIYGLAINIFCRSVISIMMNQPLQSYGSNITSAVNFKAIPVFLGFLLGGAALQSFTIDGILKRLRLIVKYPRHQSFLLQIMTGMFIYLFLNLLLYSTPLNNILLKIWSIKSCLFCICGCYIAMLYTRRSCELDEYREKNRNIEKILKERRQEEIALRRKASVDVLTGLYNRRYAEETIASMMGQSRFFTLCFLDLDGLKEVNDRYGHEEGDHYILTVTEQIRSICKEGSDLLFRYGGDEFLILFPDMDAKVAGKQMETANKRLKLAMDSQSFPYPMSFSYGLTESAGFRELSDLIQAADADMYRQKQQKADGGE